MMVITKVEMHTQLDQSGILEETRKKYTNAFHQKVAFGTVIDKKRMGRTWPSGLNCRSGRSRAVAHDEHRRDRRKVVESHDVAQNLLGLCDAHKERHREDDEF